MNADPRRWLSPAIAGLSAALALGCVVALRGTGSFYGEFPIPQHGVFHVPEAELVFYLWYGLWGGLATVFLAFAFVRSPVGERAFALVTRRLGRPRLVVGVASFGVLVLSLLLRQVVMVDQPVVDDELTYVFQAQTLARGRLVNPLPPHPPLFHNQFILLNDRGWYGKYPIGHPLVLALGEVTGTRALIVPVLGALSVWLTFLVGCRLFGARRAALGAALLCVSPQFVGTHATLLSQTTSCAFMLLALWGMLRLRDEARVRWALVAGAAWGFVVLTRPLPGVLFVGAAGLAWLRWQLDAEAQRHAWSTRLRHAGVALSVILVGVGGVLWVNTVESGTPMISGYAVPSGRHETLLPFDVAKLAGSFGGALLRQNFWLFGWAASLVFVPFARPSRGALLLWGMIAAEYGYRLLVPKTVVASTGPIYVFEIVPLLALATADGMTRVGDTLGRFGIARARVWIGATALAATVVAFVAFVPTQIGVLERAGAMRMRVYDALRERKATRAIVFANKLVEPEHGATWAYHPPNPSPDLDDDVLFLRLPFGPGGLRSIHDVWRAEFPDRRAFVYFDPPRGLVFEELDPATPPAPEASLADLLRARAEGDAGPASAR